MRSPATLPLRSDLSSTSRVILQGRIALSETNSPDSLLTDGVLERPGNRELIAVSAAMREVIAQVERVAASKAAVLIEGETGTGKELVAHLLHRASPRAHRPFLRINCAALSESLVESGTFRP